MEPRVVRAVDRADAGHSSVKSWSGFRPAGKVSSKHEPGRLRREPVYRVPAHPCEVAELGEAPVVEAQGSPVAPEGEPQGPLLDDRPDVFGELPTVARPLLVLAALGEEGPRGTDTARRDHVEIARDEPP